MRNKSTNQDGRLRALGSTPPRAHAVVCLGLIGVLAGSGCGAPLVRSDRLGSNPAIRPTKGPELCDVSNPPLFPDRLFQWTRPMVHCLAGPFTPVDVVEQYQTPVQVPHSKFHPVPTGPVFSPQARTLLMPQEPVRPPALLAEPTELEPIPPGRER